MNFLKKNFFFLSLISLVLLLQIFSLYTEPFLRYERFSILNGELWRLISAHIVHESWEHLWLNLVALLIVWMLFKNFLSNTLWCFFTFLSALGISIMLLVFMGSLEWYVGLSGVLHSMFVFGAIAGLIEGRKEFTLFLLLVVTKIVFEQFYGSNSTALLENNVIVNAHMNGAIIGFLIGGGLFVFKRKTNQEKA